MLFRSVTPIGVTPAEAFDFRRESAWDCTLIFLVITAPDIVTHSTYCALCLNALASIWNQINDQPTMTRHHLTLARDLGSSQIEMFQDKGQFTTRMTFNGRISVQANAWPALVSE